MLFHAVPNRLGWIINRRCRLPQRARKRRQVRFRTIAKSGTRPRRLIQMREPPPFAGEGGYRQSDEAGPRAEPAAPFTFVKVLLQKRRGIY